MRQWEFLAKKRKYSSQKKKQSSATLWLWCNYGAGAGAAGAASAFLGAAFGRGGLRPPIIQLANPLG